MSGVAYSVRDNGGCLFAIDTDEDGNSFLVKELLIRAEASTTNSTAYVGLTTPVQIINSKTPIYSHNGIPVSISVGKAGSKIVSWCYMNLTPLGWMGFGGYNGGAAKSNMITERNFTKNHTDGLSAIAVYCVNLSQYGFEAGSTFEIYWR